MTWFDEINDDLFEKAERARERFRTSPTYDQYVNEYAGGDESFGLWLRLVDHVMAKVVGIGHRDIGDWTWFDAYDGGQSPAEAAREALENDDTYAMFMAGHDG